MYDELYSSALDIATLSFALFDAAHNLTSVATVIDFVLAAKELP